MARPRRHSKSAGAIQPAPGVRSIAATLRDQMLAGRWKPGERIDTELALANRFGVCRSTINKALRLLQKQGLVWATRGKGRFVSEQISSPRRGRIGLLVSNRTRISHTRPKITLRGIKSVFRTSPFELRELTYDPISTSFTAADVTEQMLGLIKPHELDGIILLDEQLPLDQVLLVAGQLPVVWLEHDAIRPRIKGVRMDNLRAGFEAAAHLLDTGHRQIGLLLESDTTSRDTAIIDGARLAALRDDDASIQYLGTHISGQLDVTALICGSDELAGRATRFAEQRKLAVPQDLSVITIGPEVKTRGKQPIFTRMTGDYLELGNVAANRLITLIDQPHDVEGTAVLGMRLLSGKTTAPVPSGK